MSSVCVVRWVCYIHLSLCIHLSLQVLQEMKYLSEFAIVHINLNCSKVLFSVDSCAKIDMSHFSLNEQVLTTFSFLSLCGWLYQSWSEWCATAWCDHFRNDEEWNINTVQNISLLWLAVICCIVGVLGMVWLWWRWQENYIWLSSWIFL